MEKAPAKIMRNPKFPFLIYGDGYGSMVLESRPTTNQEGADVMEFELSPTEELVKDYNLKPVPPRDDYVYKVQLPVEFLIQLNTSPHFTRWFFLKTYSGDVTPNIKRVLKAELLQEIKDLKEAIRRKDMEIDVANENLELMRTNLPAYMKKNVFAIMQEAAPIFEKFIPEKKKND